MNMTRLRAKILDLAIRGKLVAQEEGDEPASVLLERIRAEKEELVAEKKLKKIKPLPPIQDEEKPFDIPKAWMWVRLGELLTVIGGVSYKKGDVRKEGVRVLRGGNIDDAQNIRLYDDDVFLDITQIEYDKLIQENDIIIVASTGSNRVIGKAGFVRASIENVMIGAFLRICRPRKTTYARYLRILFSSEFYRNHIRKSAKGTNINNIKQEYITDFPIPLPPLAEQARIAEKVSALFSIVERLERAKGDLQDTVERTRRKLLDLAIRGKLVAQEEGDEPASVLLERIRAEKEQLVAEKKLKKSKPLPPIKDEEKPFVIPASWTWVRLDEIVSKDIKRGKSPSYTDESDVLVFAQKCNLKCGGIDLSLAKYLDKSKLEKYPASEYMMDWDIVINSTGTGTLGRVGIYRQVDDSYKLPIVPDSHVTVVRTSSHVEARYIYAFLKFHQPYLEKQGVGSTNQKELKPAIIQSLPIPLPPLAEQVRIAALLNCAFAHLQRIEESLQ